MQKAGGPLRFKGILHSRYANACAICAGLIFIGVWVNLVGYSTAFLYPASTDANYKIIRYIYHFGRILASVSFLFLCHLYIKKGSVFLFAIPFIMCLGTTTFALSHHQTLFSSVVAGSIGSFIMGFCYMWVVATFYILLAQTYSMRSAIVIATISQVLEQFIAVLLNFGISETTQIAICFALPFCSLIALGIARKNGSPLPKGNVLTGRAKTHQFVLLIASNIALVAIGAVSNIGIWGNVRSDFLAASSEITILETAIACLVTLLLSLATLFPSTKEPLSFRYQVPFLVLIAGFMLAITQSWLFAETTMIFSIAVMAIEFFTHILVWTILMSAVNDLSTPSYKIVGIGTTAYSICSIGWIYLLENNPTNVGAIVLVISYCLIIIMAVHPRILYKLTLPETIALEEINEYMIEGEPLIPLESNGAAVAANLRNRCSLLVSKYKLSTREEEVLFLLAQGRTKPIIQKRLVLSEGTTKTHIAHIYDKMGVHSHQELLDLIFDGRIT